MLVAVVESVTEDLGGVEWEAGGRHTIFSVRLLLVEVNQKEWPSVPSRGILD